VTAKTCRPIIDPISHVGVLLKTYEDARCKMQMGTSSAIKGSLSRNPSFGSATSYKSGNSRSVIPLFGDFTNDETDLSVLERVQEARSISQSIVPSINYDAELQRSSSRPRR
jgi:hypothetical protein